MALAAMQTSACPMTSAAMQKLADRHEIDYTV